MLDNLGGTPSRALGNDAKTLPGTSLTAGMANMTSGKGPTQGIYEDAQKASQSAKSATNDLTAQAQNMSAKLSAEARDMTSSLGAEANNMTSSTSNPTGGILERVKESVSGVFSSGSKPSTDSTMAAGASAATKDTDLTEGIHEDAKGGIESIHGSSARS